MENKTKLKIGADPEFGIVDKNNQHVPANKFFRGTASLLGTDGNSRIGELRPRPNNNILFVVADIRNIFAEAVKQAEFKGLKFLAGNCVSNNPIGGHIHLELSPTLKNPWGKSELVNRLDKVLFDCLETIVSPPRERRERQRHGYGKRGNWNDTPWGIEYRPCCSWLVCPEMATIYLGLAKMSMQSIQQDLPTYVNSEKTFLTLLENKISYDKDVQIAIDLLHDFANKRQRINWDYDILKSWGTR